MYLPVTTVLPILSIFSNSSFFINVSTLISLSLALKNKPLLVKLNLIPDNMGIKFLLDKKLF